MANLGWRGIWTLLGWGLVAAIVVLSLVPLDSAPMPGMSDKVQHGLAYFTVMYWFSQLHPHRGTVALASVGLGLGLEWLQGLTPYRQPSGLDMVANSAGVLVAWLVVRHTPSPLARLVQRPS